MPKASPTSTTKERVKPPQPSSHLGRNQACHQCRRRKLRCDAARPCGPCLKYHAGIIASRAIKGEVFDLTPSCTYDDNTGIPPPAEPTPQAIPSLTPNSSAGGGQFANHHYPYTTQNGLPGSLPNLSYPVPSSASTPSPDAPGIMRQGSLPGHAGVPLADGVQFFQPMVGGSSSLAGLNYSFNQSQHQYSFGPLDMPLATNAPFDISASPTTPFGPSPTTPFPPYLHASSSTSSIPSFTPAPEASYLHQSSSSALPSHTSLPPQPSVSSHPPPPYQQYTQTQTQEVIPASYPAQLPPPALLDHLLDLFFSKVPFGDRLVHRPSFMAAVRQHPPSSPSYPSSSLLHAICAIASVYSPIIEQHVRASRTEPGRSWFEYFTHADEIELEAPGAEGAGAPGGSGEGSPGGAARRKQGIFGTEQASIARVLALFDLRTGKRVFDTVRTMICLIWYYHATGLHSEAWAMGGLAMRIATGSGLHRSGIQNDPLPNTDSVTSDWAGMYPGSRLVVEEEVRRNTFWLIWAIDMTAHMGRYDPPSIAADLVWQELPCTLQSFNLALPSQRPRQTIHDPDVLTNHPPHITDSFTLYIKSVIIGTRVATFNTRIKLERDSKINNGLLPPEAAFNPVGMFSSIGRMVATSSRGAQSAGKSPSMSPSAYSNSPGAGVADPNGGIDPSITTINGGTPTASPLENTAPHIPDMPEFKKLEAELAAFRTSFPPAYADVVRSATFGPPSTSPSTSRNENGRNLKSVDGALYLAHTIAALSVVRLHEAHADLYSPEDRSRNQVIRAGSFLTDSVHTLIATSFEISLIYPTAVTVWLNAGRILIIMYQISVEQGHLDDAGRLLSEVDALAVAMGRMGERIPLALIGTGMLNGMIQAATSGNAHQRFFERNGPKDP